MLTCSENANDLEDDVKYRLVIKGKALQAMGFDDPFVYDKTFDTKKEADTEFTVIMNQLAR